MNRRNSHLVSYTTQNTDTPLTDDGVVEATVAGQMLEKSGMLFDEVHTSLLRRSIRTTNLVLMETGQEYLTVNKSWRLNERHYGDLVGRNKKEAVMEHGIDQVKRWRRSFDEPPPEMKEDHPYNPKNDPRYKNVSASDSLLLPMMMFLMNSYYSIDDSQFSPTFSCDIFFFNDFVRILTFSDATFTSPIRITILYHATQQGILAGSY